MTRQAVFLDRDGTIIDDVEYLATPDQVTLLPDAVRGVRRLNVARVDVIVVTNQSGIARGYFTLDDYERVRRHLDALLAEAGAHIDATYFCPHHPDFGGHCDCRKPGLGMYRQAATEHDVDLARSLYLGDRWRDVEPALAFGGRGILVPAPRTPPDEIAAASVQAEVASSLIEAVDRWLSSPQGPPTSVVSAHPQP